MADKRRVRQGQIGGNITPQQAKTQLALPVVALLRGDAVPIFPGTSLAGPSGKVGIFRKPGICRSASNQHVMRLPVWLNDKQWETAVVPVLTDPRWSPQNPYFNSLWSLNSAEALRQVAEALAQSFHEAGYGPLPE